MMKKILPIFPLDVDGGSSKRPSSSEDLKKKAMQSFLSDSKGWQGYH